MTDADAEDEATGVLLAERLGAIGHGHWIAGVDVGNAGSDDRLIRGAQKQRGVRHDLLAAEALGDPDGRVAQLLECSRCRRFLSRRQPLEGEVPDVQRTERVGEIAAAEPAVAADAADAAVRAAPAAPVVRGSVSRHPRIFAKIVHEVADKSHGSDSLPCPRTTMSAWGACCASCD